jgi:hypothetical protein
MTRSASPTVATPIAPPHVGSIAVGRRHCPLLIDVINDLAFQGSEILVAQAESVALRLSALKRRATVGCVRSFQNWQREFVAIASMGVARRLPSITMVAGIETGARAACRNGT